MTWRGYESNSTPLFRTACSQAFRGTRVADNLPVILKQYDSGVQLQREERILRSLFGKSSSVPRDALCFDAHLGVSLQVVDVLEECHAIVFAADVRDALGFVADLFETQVDIATTIDIGIAIATLLNVVHGNRIIIGGLSPHHLLRSSSGIVLLDFERSFRFDAAVPSTTYQRVSYLAPEQIVAGRCDHQSDLYVLGLILYRLATNFAAYSATNDEELVYQLHDILATTLVPACVRNPRVPPLLSSIVMKLLATDAAARYESAFGLRADLHRFGVLYKKAGHHVDVIEFELGQNDVPISFRMPRNAIFGREHELQELTDMYDRVAREQKSRCLLVAGEPGVGKSALLAELQLRRPQALRMCGKYEQEKIHIPYSGFSQAVTQLVRQLLAVPPEELQLYKQSIMRAVGISGNVLTRVFPELSPLLDLPKHLPSVLGPEDATKRFVEMFLSLLRVLVGRGKVILLLLDDMQWADPSSLRLWEAIVASDVPQLLIVAAYRDNEITKGHPFEVSLRAHNDSDVFHRVHVQPLQRDSIISLIGAITRMSPIAAAPLAEDLLSKTLGNPFFVMVYLRRLYEAELLRFDENAGHWTYSRSEIDRIGITENAAQCMTAGLARLDPEILRPLLIASCFGTQFSLAVVALAGEAVEEQQLRRVFRTLIDQSYIIELAPDSYKFSHDTVQSAAYAMLGAKEKELLHLRFGRSLLARGQQESLFDTAWHCNRGAQNISDARELKRFAELNLSAAEKALQSAAGVSAQAFAEAGLTLLVRSSPEHWLTERRLSFRLTLQLAISLHLGGNHEAANQHFAMLLSRSSSLDEKAEVYVPMLELYLSSCHYVALWEIAKDCLQSVGVLIDSLSPSDGEVAVVVRDTLTVLQQRSLGSIADAPEDVYHPTQRCLQQLLAVAYFRSTALCTLIAAHATMLMLKRGVNQYAAMNLTYFAWMISARLSIDAERAVELGALAIRMSDRFFDLASMGVVYMIYGAHVHVLTHHPRDALSYLCAALKASLDSYSYLNASFNAALLTETHLMTSATLDDAIAQCNYYCAMLRSPLRFEDMLSAGECCKLWLTALQQGPSYLTGFDFWSSAEATDLEKRITARGVNLPICAFHSLKAVYYFSIGRHAEAMAAASVALPIMDSCVGLNTVAFYYYPHFALTQLALLQQTPPERRTAAESEAPQKLLDILQLYSKISPRTYGLVFKLVQGRVLEVLHHDALAAAQLYEEALSMARTEQYHYWHGLCLVLSADNARASGMRTAAGHMYAAACKVWASYGAATLVAVLVRQYATIMDADEILAVSNKRPSPNDTMSAQIRAFLPFSAQLDAHTVLQVTRALSQEIDLEKLLDEVMRILLANAGADFACLALANLENNVLEIVAEMERDIQAQKRRSLAEFDPDTAGVLRSVHVTREAVFLDDVDASSLLIQQHRLMRAKSILCLPLRSASVLGVLYVENRRSTGLLRRDLIEAILPQVAICIEKAQLVRRLMRASTELEQKNAELELADIRKDRFLAITTHELRTPLHGIISASSVLADSQLTDEQRVACDIIRTASTSLSTLISDILDISRLRTSTLRANCSSFSVVALVERALEVVGSAAAQKGLELAYELEGSDSIMTRRWISDPQRLQQVLTNLLVNAIKFTSSGYVLLTISLRTPPNSQATELCFVVRDTGVGISAEQFPLLFALFSQLEHTNTTVKYDGYGMGLYICHALVQILGGRITAESEGIARGSKFTVIVPVTMGEPIAMDPAPVGVAIARTVLVQAEFIHTERILARVLDRFGVKVKKFNANIHDDSSVLCVVTDFRYLTELQAHLHAWKVELVVLTYPHQWRTYSHKGSIRPLYKPLRHASIIAAVFETGRATEVVAPVVVGDSSTFATTVTNPSLCILVVDDNHSNSTILTHILRARYDIQAATNGLEAIAAVKKRRPDLIFMDVQVRTLVVSRCFSREQMPIMDGLTATKELRQLGYQMPIIAATASTEDKTGWAGIGITDILSKPFTRKAVLEVARTYLAARAMGGDGSSQS